MQRLGSKYRNLNSRYDLFGLYMKTTGTLGVVTGTIIGYKAGYDGYKNCYTERKDYSKFDKSLRLTGEAFPVMIFGAAAGGLLGWIIPLWLPIFAGNYIYLSLKNDN